MINRFVFDKPIAEVQVDVLRRAFKVFLSPPKKNGFLTIAVE
jgi:hypothetical protein